MICPEDDDKCPVSELVVDYWGEITLLIHEGKKAEYLFLNYVTFPDPRSTYNDEFHIVMIIIERLLESGDTDKRNKIATRCMVVSEKNTTGVQCMYTMEKTGIAFTFRA